MELVHQTRTVRVYRATDGTHHFRDIQTQGYLSVIEKSIYDSRDPADVARVGQLWAQMRAQLAVFFAENEDLDISSGILDQRVQPGFHLRLDDGSGLVVPAVALIVEQPYWPAPPTEDAP